MRIRRTAGDGMCPADPSLEYSFRGKLRKIKPVAIKCPALCRPTMMRRSRQPVFVSVQQFHADLAGTLDSYFCLNILSV